MGLLTNKPRDLYDALVPLEYQPLVERAFLTWCIGCWAVALVMMLLRRGQGKRKKLKKKLKDR